MATTQADELRKLVEIVSRSRKPGEPLSIEEARRIAAEQSSIEMQRTEAIKAIAESLKKAVK